VYREQEAERLLCERDWPDLAHAQEPSFGGRYSQATGIEPRSFIETLLTPPTSYPDQQIGGF
jgi:hypothetical protein